MKTNYFASILVAAAFLFAAPLVAAQSMQDMQPSGIEIGVPQSQPAPSANGGPITFYGDRGTFDAANPGLPCEDFEDFENVIAGCDAPSNSGTSCPGGYDVGDIEPGLELDCRDNSGPGLGGMVIIPSGFDGNASIVYGSNFFTDNTILNFGPAVRAVGFDVQCHFGSPEVVIDVFDDLGALVASTTSACANAGTFLGMDSSSPNGIASVTIEDLSGVSVESVEDVCFGGVPVPVELIGFNATINGSTVNLDWQTASETNNAGFEVQLQSGENWDVLAFVDGNGTTTEAQNYTFAAEGMGVGTHIFRLKQIDFDGAFEYSPEIEASVETPGTHLLTAAYPNPFNPQSQFTLAVGQDQLVTAELFNTLGQRVAVLFSGAVEANQAQLVTIDGAGLASGMYVVRVNGENFSDALSVTLLK